MGLNERGLPDSAVGQLAMHLALAMHMIQNGTSYSLLQQQLITVRRLSKAVLDDEDTPGDTHVQITQPIPESVAEALAEDVIVPDDLNGWED